MIVALLRVLILCAFSFTDGQEQGKALINLNASDDLIYPRMNPDAQVYMQSHLQYPAMARENGIEGEVKLLINLDCQGTVTRAVVFAGPGYGCNQEAVRLVQNMPVWTPAYYHGVPIPITVIYVIRFRLW